MFFDEEKKMLLTVSTDKSIRLHQFPIFWPSEMIRKSSMKNKIHLITEEGKEAVKDDLIEETREGLLKEEDLEIQNTKEEGLKSKLDLLLQNQINKDLTNVEINCGDLDGWDADL